jgi:negative regulator of sigma-B (phosphoserine phosphatase)
VLTIEHHAAPCQGEAACGDAVVVRAHDGVTLVAIIDALGHGARAEAVALLAREWLMTTPLDGSVETLMSGLHAALRGSRGACGLVCLITRESIEGCSVGNVDMRWLKARPPFMLTPGVLGLRMDRPRVFRTRPAPRERIVAFSDGVSARFDLHDTASLSTGAACHAIFGRYRRAHDDAALLVADFES